MKSVYFLFVDATAWFIFISGYLLSHIEFINTFDFKAYIAKKIKFVLMPYFILSIPSILAALYFHRPQLYDLTSFEYTLWALLVGGDVIGPMWFVPMIFLFFLISPIIYKINRIYLPYITLFFLIFSIFSWRPYKNFNPFLSFIHFFGFYLLGIYCNLIRERIYSLKRYFALLIISTGFLVFGVLLFWYNENFFVQSSFVSFYTRIGEFNPIQLGKLILLICFFILFERFCNKRISILGGIAKISFGLFFIHGFYLIIFSRFVEPLTSEGPLKLFAEFIFVIPLSIFTVNAVKFIFKSRSRYVIGC